MKPKEKHLKKLSERCELVSIYRKSITSSTLYGFIVGHSDKFVCFLLIDEFHADGLSVIRRKDISKLRASDSNRLHKQMLEADGVLETLDLSHCPPLGSWRELFESVPDEEIVIIENETTEDPLFFIGKILSAEQKLVAGHYFNGTGDWDDDPWEIAYKKITRCQLNTNYGNAYGRHFVRLEAADKG